VPRLERLGQQADVPGRKRLPGERHLQGVVRDLALAGVDIGDDVVGVDDRLRLEQEGGGSQTAYGVERLDEGVRLGEVLARRSDPLPDERDGVHPQHVDAEVGEEQHLAGHRPEHCRVGVVEVPLEGVEGRPHPSFVLSRFVPGELVPRPFVLG